MNAHRPIDTVRTYVPPKFLYPVMAREGWGVKAIAWFADYYKAVDMVNANVGKRFMYIGEPEQQS